MVSRIASWPSVVSASYPAKGLPLLPPSFAEVLYNRFGRKLTFLHREEDAEGENRIGKLMRVTDANETFPGVVARLIAITRNRADFLNERSVRDPPGQIRVQTHHLLAEIFRLVEPLRLEIGGRGDDADAHKIGATGIVQAQWSRCL